MQVPLLCAHTLNAFVDTTAYLISTRVGISRVFSRVSRVGALLAGVFFFELQVICGLIRWGR